MHDEKTPEVPLSEVSRQVADLERACAHLEESIGELERHCVSVISSTLKEERGVSATPQPALCPLAASLRTYVQCIEAAHRDIEALIERIEL